MAPERAWIPLCFIRATLAAKEVEITAHIRKLVEENEVQVADRYFGLKIAGDRASDAGIDNRIDM